MLAYLTWGVLWLAAALGAIVVSRNPEEPQPENPPDGDFHALVDPFALKPATTAAKAPILVIEAGLTAYSGWWGYWLDTTATTYSPHDPIDSAYVETKGKWRWKTADGETDVRKRPFGIAISRSRTSTGLEPDLAYGTRVMIPWAGYAQSVRSRVFTVDDTGSRLTKRRKSSGITAIDLRCPTYREALKVAGKHTAHTLPIFVMVKPQEFK